MKLIIIKKEENDMKSTGIVRKVDKLGRIVLPSELRETLNIKIKEPLEIDVNGDSIVLRKYLPACVFCGEAENTSVFKGKHVCKACLRSLNKKSAK